MPPSTPSPYPGTWHVQYSTRDLWHGRRNVHAIFTDTNSLDYTYQEISAVEIRSHQELSWDVVGNGKDGKLESWMKETEMGIEDTSGEIRADWRSIWMAVFISTGLESPGGIDVLCNRQKRIGDETMNDIQGIITSKADRFLDLKGVALLQVPDDGARNSEIKKAEEQRQLDWEKRTGKNEGISEDLIYDDEEKESSKCVVQ